MKTNFFAISLTILIILVFTNNFSYASDEKAYVAKENEELYGTWVNEDYNSSIRHAIQEYKSDGTWIDYQKTTDEIPYEDGTYTITDKWTDSYGDICYKIRWETPYLGRSGYGLNCISDSGSTMKSANSFSDYPTQINPSKGFPTYLGIHYRKQK